MLYGAPADSTAGRDAARLAAWCPSRSRSWCWSSPVSPGRRASATRSSRSRRSWATEMAPGTLEALAQALRETGGREVTARGADQIEGRLRRRADPRAGRAARRPRRAVPAPRRRRHARTVRRLHARLRLRARIAPAAGLRARLDRPGGPRVSVAGNALVRGQPVRARDPRSPRPRPARPSGSPPAGAPPVLAGGLPSAAPRRRAAQRSRRRGPALPVPPRGRRGTVRDHRGAGARRHHRARPLPLHRRGRDDRQSRDPAGLRPQGHREALRDAAVRADARARGAHLRRHQRGPRARLLPGAGSPRPAATCRRGPAGFAPSCSSSSGSTTTWPMSA